MFEIFKNKRVAFIVYQMGKVGSSTIRKGLKNKYGRKRILHTHNHDEAKEYIEKWRKTYEAVVVITGFREPLARCISAYFQNTTNAKNHWFYVGGKDEVERKSTDWLINDFNAKVVPHVNQIVNPWLKKYECVVDCGLESFGRFEGCLKASVDNVHLYIYKLEALDGFYQRLAVEPFMENIKFVNTNMSDEKWYADAYVEFKSKYKISRSEYHALYGNIDYVQSMYGKDELIGLTQSFICH